MVFLALLFYESILLLLAAFFSGYETGVVTIAISKIEEKKRKARFFQQWLAQKLTNPEKIIASCLVATNFFLITAIIVLILYLLRLGFKHTLAELITIILITPFTLFLCDAMPKVVFRRHPLLIFKLAFPFYLLYHLIYPLLYLFYLIPEKILTIFLMKKEEKKFKTQQQLRYALSQIEKREGLERSSVERIFEIGKKHVKEIAIPFKKVSYINPSATIEEAKIVFKETGFSRLPLYDEKEAKVFGVLHFLDVFLSACANSEKVTKLSKPALFVDDNEYLDDLLYKMQKEKIYLAVVRNKIGQIVGIVTIKDILEELIGEY